METIGTAEFLFCALVVLGAFAIRSTTGFGSAAVAVPLAALVLPVQTVIAVVSNLQLVTTVDYSARHWRVVAWHELLRIVPCILAGVLIGLYLFYRLDVRAISKGLGIFVIAYAAWVMATARRAAEPRRRLPWPISVALNTVGALIGALFGSAASPFYAMYLRALRLSRDAFRATMTMILLTQVVLRVAGYASMGFIDAYTALLTLGALPFMQLGAKLGDMMAGHIAQGAFNRVLGTVLLVSGFGLILK